jgi:hypothetical protein
VDIETLIDEASGVEQYTWGSCQPLLQQERKKERKKEREKAPAYQYCIRSIGETSSVAGFERVGDGHRFRLLLHQYQLNLTVSASVSSIEIVLKGDEMSEHTMRAHKPHL